MFSTKYYAHRDGKIIRIVTQFGFIEKAFYGNRIWGGAGWDGTGWVGLGFN